MAKQKEILDKTLDNWKQDVQQLDDILVFRYQMEMKVFLYDHLPFPSFW